MEFQNSAEFARKMDETDALRDFRAKFYIPKQASGEDVLYFTGNSLGLQPRSARAFIEQELKDWENLGVEGHFAAKNPWMPYHALLTEQMADVVGAKTIETVVMNSLTVNLHLLLVSFYRPAGKRNKIVIEKGAFPSDQYAVDSQIKFHETLDSRLENELRITNYELPVTSDEQRTTNDDPRDETQNPKSKIQNPKSSRLIELAPRAGENHLRTEDIERVLRENADEIALIMLGGVNYYTGQAFDMRRITEIGHEIGAVVGFDLAHAAGNLHLRLHDWDVDFAAWCSYKYLNSGPGGIAGAFVHERHAENFDLPRFAGWWGHDQKIRFLMGDRFQPMRGAEGWQLSNPPIFQMASLRASLEIFAAAGMENLRAKSIKLTNYLEYLLSEIRDERIEIITPADENMRGCQLSIRVKSADKNLFNRLTEKGVIADWREPDVIRVAPVPLYNSFTDVWKFARVLESCLS